MIHNHEAEGSSPSHATILNAIGLLISCLYLYMLVFAPVNRQIAQDKIYVYS